VLAKEKGDKPFLQGWAVVENQSDEDWKDVRMALVSGRPISFRMDLYQPLYVQRPLVEPELFASLRPVAYSGALDGERGWAETKWVTEALAEQRRAGGKGDAKGGEGKSGDAKDGKPGDRLDTFGRPARDADDDVRLNQGVASAASASKLGDFFQYSVDKPVSLARQKSALLPIVNKEVEGTRVSIYNERTQA